MIAKIKRAKAKRVLLQFPDGLRKFAFRICRLVEDNTEALPMVSIDPCYGACDLPTYQGKKLGVELIVHFGHTPYGMLEEIPIVYLETTSKIDVLKTVKKALPFLKGKKKIGLATTVQHIAELQRVRKLLESEGIQSIIGRKKGQIKYDGQILGCNYSAMQQIDDAVDAFLLVGSMFHALGAAITLRKNVILADPYQDKVVDLRERKRDELKRRWARISEAREITEFGIIVSIKTGQLRFDEAVKIKDLLERSGRRGTLLISSEVLPETLKDFPEFGAYINTACPRLSMDDAYRFRSPVLSVDDVEILLGLKKWTSYVDGIYPEERTQEETVRDPTFSVTEG